MKKSVGKLFVLTSIAVSALLACNGNNDKGDSNTYKTVNIYAQNDYGYPENVGQMDLYFFDVEGLPYVNIADYLYFFGNLFEVSHSNDVFTFTNRIWNTRHYKYNGELKGEYSTSARYNTSTKVFTYDDYACFSCVNGIAYNPLDLVCGEGIEVTTGLTKHRIMQHKDNGYIPGSQISINLNDYNIETVVSGNNLYMPLYTAKTLFLPKVYYSFFYNGKALYQSVENTDDDEGYSKSIRNTLSFTPNSKYLVYTYNQFRLDLKLRFGMENYERTLRSGGTKEYSAGTELANYRTDMIKSATNFDNNVVKFMANEMDDGGHTVVTSKSYFSSNPKIYLEDLGKEYKQSYNVYSNIKNNRNNGKDLKSYIENFGDDVDERTVLRLDDFLTGDDYDGVNCILKLASTKIANNHLVIDLSLNGGGYVYAQYYLVNLLCGSTQRNYYMNSTNGSKGYVEYDIDSNLDGEFNGADYTIGSDVTIDFIISNFTFSAANATAVLTQKLRTSGTTRFRGQNSGGGMCSVDGTMMTALGMNMSWSSPDRLCCLDGDKYSCDLIDKGVTKNITPLDNYSDYSDYTFSIS